MHKINFALKILAVVFAVLVISNTAMGDEKPEIFVQMGHSSVQSIAFSSCGRYAATGSEKGTTKIWDVATGREIRTFTGHGAPVHAVAVSTDGKFVLSGDEKGIIKLWDAITGNKIMSFKGHTGDIRFLSFSADTRFFASDSLGWHDKMKIWNSRTGQLVRTVDCTHGIPSSGEKFVVTGFGGSPALTDIFTGSKILTFQNKNRSFTLASFSHDGKYGLLQAGFTSKTVEFVDLQTSETLASWTFDKDIYCVALSPNGRYGAVGTGEGFKLLDVMNGKILKTLTTSFTSHAIFSPNNQYLLSTGLYSPALWDVSLKKFVMCFKRAPLNRLDFSVLSPSGKQAISINSNAPPILWDMASGKLIKIFKGYKSGSSFKANGKYILLVRNDGVNEIFDLSAQQAVKKFKGESFRLSPDGSYVMERISDRDINVWQVATGKKILNFTERSNKIALSFIFPDSKHLFVLSGNVAKRIDIATGAETKLFALQEKYCMRAAISPDSKFIAVFMSDDQLDWHLQLHDIHSGKKAGSYNDVIPAASAVFSPDSRYMLFAQGDRKKLVLCDVATGAELRTFKGHGDIVWDMEFSRGGDRIISGDCSGKIILWDTATGKDIMTFSGHSASVTSVQISPDGEQIISTSDDNTTRLWDTSTGQEIAQFISFTDGEWIIITPEGYYNSSANGDKHLNVSIGNNVYGIDQYRATFYKPRIVEAALRGVNIEEAVARVAGEHKAAPSVAYTEPPFVVIKSPEDGKKINSTDAEISLYIEDRNQTIKKVKVFVNGRVAAGAEGRGIKVTGAIPEGKKSMDLNIPVHLDIGENLIEVTAFNGFSEGRKSIRVYSLAASTKGKVILPNLWILSIGINRYQDKKLTSLSYAAADAEGIIKAFSGQKGKLFREINTLVINDHSHIKPTYENIVDNLNYLSKAGHNDVAILFIAGHGMNDDRGEFYFLPSDAVITEDGTIKRSLAISWREIKSILDIPAKKLLFADTCHSEGVSGKKTRGVDSDRFVKELQGANAVIFTSSRGRELSQESDKWKHGAFTYALIEGIKGKADLIKDNKISMKELDAYVSETVPKITSGAQHPITNTPDGYVNFPVAIVK